MFYIKSYFEKHKFIKNIATLMSGTVLAQLITFLSMLLITNFYTASDFGVYALFISISSIFTVIATGRYELAIILPKRHSTALNILALITFISLVFCFVLFCFISFSYSFIVKCFNIQLDYNVLQLLPIFIFFSSLSQSFYYFFNRFAEYKIMSLSRILYSSCNALMMVFWGKTCLFDNGLIISCLISNLVLVLFYIINFSKKYKNSFWYIRWTVIKILAFRYKNFPKYTLLSTFIENTSLQMPTFLLSIFYNSEIVGYYALSYRCIAAPLQIITTSFGDVFRKNAINVYLKLGNCVELFESFSKKLLCFSLILFFPFIIFGREIFIFIFGIDWEISGIFTQILSPAYILRLIASPMSNITYILEKQKFDLLLQVLNIIIVFSFVYLANLFFNNVYVIIASFTSAYLIIYAISLYLNYNWSKG